MPMTRSQTLQLTASNATVQTPTIKQVRAAAKRAKDSNKVRNEERHRNCFGARKAQAEAAAAQYLGSLRYLGANQMCPNRMQIRLQCLSMNLIRCLCHGSSELDTAVRSAEEWLRPSSRSLADAATVGAGYFAC
jgi:hypothetical protein